METATSNARAWRTALGSFLLVVMTNGAYMLLILYFPYYMKEFGLGRGEVSLTFTFTNLLGMIFSLLIGRILKTKINVRILSFIGGVCVALSYILASMATSMTLIYVGGAFLGIGTVFSGMVIAQIYITNWFDKLRGTVMAVCVTGGAIAGAILSPIVGTLIVGHGWRTVSRIEGIVIIIVALIICLFLISEAPEKYGLKPYGYQEKPKNGEGSVSSDLRSNEISIGIGQAVKTPVFWVITIVLSLFSTIIAQGVSSQQTFIYGSFGLSAVAVASMVTVFMIARTLYAWVYGVLIDKLGMRKSTLIIYVIALVGFIIVLSTQTKVGLWAFAILLPAGPAIASLLTVNLLIAVFGKKDSGSLIGNTHAFLNLGAMTGPIFSGFLFDKYNSYQLPFTVYVVFIVLGILITFWALSKGQKERIAKLAASKQQ